MSIPIAKATSSSEQPFRLGDDLEKALTAVGITKDRWVEVKRKLGLPPTCNCKARQEWLNRAGEILQVKSQSLWSAIASYYSRPR